MLLLVALLLAAAAAALAGERVAASAASRVQQLSRDDAADVAELLRRDAVAVIKRLRDASSKSENDELAFVLDLDDADDDDANDDADGARHAARRSGGRVLTVAGGGGGGGDAFLSIQAAVDAAAPGDVIDVLPHRDVGGYAENVVVRTPDITLRGRGRRARADFVDRRCPRTRLSGCATPDVAGDADDRCGGVVLQVLAARVTIEYMDVRSGEVQLGDGAHGAVVRFSCLQAHDNALVTLNSDGDDARVNNVRVHANVFPSGNRHAVDAGGSHWLIDANVCAPCDEGFEVEGDDAVMARNYALAGNDNEAFNVKGDRGIVADNVVLGSPEGIRVSGARCEVMDNVLLGVTGSAVEASGAGQHVVARNYIAATASAQYAVAVESSDACGGTHVVDNVVVGATGAIRLACDQSVAARNTVVASGNSNTNSLLAAAVVVDGAADARVEENTLSDCSGTGIGVVGDGAARATISGNRLRNGARGGIVLRSGDGHSLVNNSVLGHHGEGIALHADVAAALTAFTDNRSQHNRVDLCVHGDARALSALGAAAQGQRNVLDAAAATCPVAVQDGL